VTPTPPTGLLDRRLLFVTGKGGVGKTVVASALGALGAAAGKRTLVCEMEPRGDLSAAFDCGVTRYEPKVVQPGLSVMTMNTEAALREYLKMTLHIPAIGRLGPLADAFDFVAAAAPGVREILTVGKLFYEVRRDRYDLVVVDAAATGHIVGHLGTPVALGELVKRGLVAEQARSIAALLDDPEMTGIVVVTTPEEMPVHEAIELVDRLGSETGTHVAAIVANRVLPELFARNELEVFDTLLERTSSHGPAADASAVADVLGGVELIVRRRRASARHLDTLRSSVPPELPLLYLPLLFGRVHGPRAVALIARALGEELGA
jgi:anion-transporting  ArsA/GET3 family ATPase